jgi:hypothetical protein
MIKLNCFMRLDWRNGINGRFWKTIKSSKKQLKITATNIKRLNGWGFGFMAGCV